MRAKAASVVHAAWRPQLPFLRQFSVCWACRNQKREQKIRSDWTTGTTGLHHISKDVTEAYINAPLVDSRQLASCKTPARDVKMLVRDYIDDSLYNPNYGYFNRHVSIFSPPRPIEFGKIRDSFALQDQLAAMYSDYEDKLDLTEGDSARQVWHTPTELFQPYYGEAIAQYLVTQYKLTHFPYKDLIIYELGAGNGTLMSNILDYIAREEPEIYQCTKYKVIEISSTLAEKQTSRINELRDQTSHRDRITILNQSIFDWNVHEPEPCFVLAMEVFDNFAHDLVRYDLISEQPRQGLVYIDEDGDFHEMLSEQLHPSTQRLLSLRKAVGLESVRRPFKTPQWFRRILDTMPLAPNMSMPEFIPTNLLQFMDILFKYFPNHRLVASDFSDLPNRIPGIQSPVVQTRHQRTMIPCSTILVAQGYFDYVFPTDWNLLHALYRTNAHRSSGGEIKILTHKEFLSVWAETDLTETRSRDNPMLDWYQNVNFFLT